MELDNREFGYSFSIQTNNIDKNEIKNIKNDINNLNSQIKDIENYGSLYYDFEITPDCSIDYSGNISGGVDQSDKFIEAIEFMSSNNKYKLKLPEGIIRVSNINLSKLKRKYFAPEGGCFIIEGSGAGTILYNDSNNEPTFFTEHKDNMTALFKFENITFMGGDNSGICIDIQGKFANFLSLENVHIEGFDVGISAYDLTGCTIMNTKIKKCRFAGINAGYKADVWSGNNLAVVDCPIGIHIGYIDDRFGSVNATGNGESWNAISVAGCDVGVWINSQFTNSINFIGCYFEGNKTSHIKIGNLNMGIPIQSVEIQNCYFNGNITDLNGGGKTKYFIDIYNTQYCKITGGAYQNTGDAIIKLNQLDANIEWDLAINANEANICELPDGTILKFPKYQIGRSEKKWISGNYSKHYHGKTGEYAFDEIIGGNQNNIYPFRFGRSSGGNPSDLNASIQYKFENNIDILSMDNVFIRLSDLTQYNVTVNENSRGLLSWRKRESGDEIIAIIKNSDGKYEEFNIANHSPKFKKISVSNDDIINNTILYSNDFTQTNWVKSTGIGVEENTVEIISPNNDNTSTKLFVEHSVVSANISQNITPQKSNGCMGVILSPADTFTAGRLRLRDLTDNQDKCYVDFTIIDDKLVIINSNGISSIEKIGAINGKDWWFIKLASNSIIPNNTLECKIYINYGDATIGQTLYVDKIGYNDGYLDIPTILNTTNNVLTSNSNSMEVMNVSKLYPVGGLDGNGNLINKAKGLSSSSTLQEVIQALKDAGIAE